MTRAQLRDWLDAYERAWRTAGTEPLPALFSPDAAYLTAPYERPYRGLAEIGEMWEREREGPDEVFEIDSRPVAVENDVAVVRVEVRYGDPVTEEYRELWIVRLDGSGRCVEFEEWPFWPPGQESAAIAGPSDGG